MLDWLLAPFQAPKTYYWDTHFAPRRKPSDLNPAEVASLKERYLIHDHQRLANEYGLTVEQVRGIAYSIWDYQIRELDGGPGA